MADIRKPVTADGEKRAKKVVSGNVKIKKKSGLSSIFVADDIQKVKSYIMQDVVIPLIKNAIWDSVSGSLKIALFGDSAAKKGTTKIDRVSYNDYYGDRYSANRNNNRATTTRNTYSYQDIIIDNRGEAEEVLAQMDGILEKYERVRVADLYDLVGITGEFTDNRYGWTDLHTAKIVRVREGYIIDLPRPTPLD